MASLTALECVQIGDAIYCQCGNPSAHYGTMGERGARVVKCEPPPPASLPSNEMTPRPLSQQARERIYAEHLRAAISALDMRNAYRGPMAPDRTILVALAERLELMGSQRETKCATHGAEHRMRDELPCPWCVIDELKRNRDAAETTARQTKTSEWHAALLAEIETQKALIDHMDNVRNHEMRDNGIMTVLRAERLELLEKLLAFEPAFSEKSAPSAAGVLPTEASSMKEASGPATVGADPYFVRTFWSPDARYLVTAHATREGIITLQDDNGKEWRATGPQEDMANRCHCGAYEWKLTTGKITDPQGRLHLKDRCSPVKSGEQPSPPPGPPTQKPDSLPGSAGGGESDGVAT